MNFYTKLLISILSTILANILYAKPKKIKVTSQKQNPTTIDHRIGVSERNRQNKKFEFALQPAGLMNIVGFDIGGMAAYYLTENSHLVLTYTQSNFQFLGLQYQTQFINAAYRFFWGNSLNSMIGVGYMNDIKIDNNFFYGSLLEKEVKYQFTSKSIGLLASIGNRWYWDGFMIGCDWATIFQPLSISTSIDAEGEEEIDEIVAKKEQHENDAEKYYWEFVKFQIGMTF